MSKQALAAGILRWTGFGAMQRLLFARRRVSIVVYHDPEPENLRKHLAWYAKRYNFTTLDAVANALETGRWGDLPPYPLVVTFDDGHKENAKLAPIFREFGVRPTVYLCSQIVGTTRPYWWKTPAADSIGVESLKRVPDGERRRRLAEAGNDPDRETDSRQSLTWDEVLRLRDVVDYGAHTRTHPILLQCDDHRVTDEIALCKAELEEALGEPCRHFAFPNGDFSDREVDIIRRAGYRTARTIDPGWNGPNADPLRLKAVPVSDDAPVEWLAVQVTGLTAWLRKRKGDADPMAPAASHGQPVPAA